MMTEGWLEDLMQRLPRCRLLTLVDTTGVGETRTAGSRAGWEIDLAAIQATATDLELGDRLLELQSLVRDDLPIDGATRRRETLFLAEGLVLLFVRDPSLSGATLIAVCEADCNLGLVLVQVRSALQSLTFEVVV